jgi:hypothetical protein
LRGRASGSEQPRVARTTGCPRSRSDTRIEAQAGLMYAPGMTRKWTYDRQGHAHLVTSYCFPRRRLPDHDRTKKDVLGGRDRPLPLQRSKGIGFAILPGHVPAIVHLPEPDAIRRCIKQWEPCRSVPMQRLLRGALCWYGRDVDLSEPVRQARHDDSHLFSAKKARRSGSTSIRTRYVPVSPCLPATDLELGAVGGTGPDRGSCRRPARLNSLAAAPP